MRVGMMANINNLRQGKHAIIVQLLPDLAVVFCKAHTQSISLGQAFFDGLRQ
jgi:hypothetical protein